MYKKTDGFLRGFETIGFIHAKNRKVIAQRNAEKHSV